MNTTNYIAEMAIRFQQAYSNRDNQSSERVTADRFQVLLQWPKQPKPAMEFPSYTEEQQKAMYFTETYTKRVLSWLCMLQWPSELDVGDPGVTYLELFLDFYLTCLSHLGVRGARGGLRCRPKLVYPEKVLQLVASASPLNATKVFSVDNVDVPVPELPFDIPMQPTDAERKAQSSYKKFRSMTRKA